MDEIIRMFRPRKAALLFADLGMFVHIYIQVLTLFIADSVNTTFDFVYIYNSLIIHFGPFAVFYSRFPI